jgi:hypothetical protein
VKDPVPNSHRPTIVSGVAEDGTKIVRRGEYSRDGPDAAVIVGDLAVLPYSPAVIVRRAGDGSQVEING